MKMPLYVSTDSSVGQQDGLGAKNLNHSSSHSSNLRRHEGTISPRSSTGSSRSQQSVLKRCSSAESRVESSRCSANSLSHPLRQCILHRSSSSAASVPTGWWHQPNSDLWNERYQMAAYLCSIGRFGKLYTCYSEKTGEELTVKVVRKSRWSNARRQQGTTESGQQDWIEMASTIDTNMSASISSLDQPKMPQRPSHYLNHPHRNHLQEYSILKSLQHPNILQVFDLIEDPQHYYIVTEYYDPNTQSLQAHIQNQQGPFSELEVGPIMYQMLSCINYCHHRYVVHCNLRLDAFSIITPSGAIKLTDFGNAVLLCDLTDDKQRAANLRLMQPRGTIRYMAPEVVTLDKSYGPKCDVWSLGIILYVLLAGVFPLDGSSFKDVQELVLATLENPHWLIQKFRQEIVWQTISDECKHFVHRLLAPMEEDRPTPEQALQHPWMLPHWNFSSASASTMPRQYSCGVSTITEDSFCSDCDINTYNSSSSFASSDASYQALYKSDPHRLTSSLLTASTASQQPLEVIEELAPSFSGDSFENDASNNSGVFPGKQLELQQIEAIDTFLQCHNQILREWNTTYNALKRHAQIDIQEQSLHRDDVRKAYKVLFNANLGESDLNKVFAEFDRETCDTLQGLDFFVAVLNEKDLLFTHALQEAFEVFDTNHSGLVSTSYLSKALRAYAKNENLSTVDKSVVEDLLDQVETDVREMGTDVIALEELVAMILESSIPKPSTSNTNNNQGNNNCNNNNGAMPPNPQPLEARDPSTSAGSSTSLVQQSPSWGSSQSGATATNSRRSSTMSRRRASTLDRLSLIFSAKHFIAQRPGRLSHHYELTDFVNEGGCGAVWFCTHKETGAERAVKLVRKAQMDADYNKRILEEFLILRELDHPNILKQYELFEDPNFFYIVMDAARGGDLCDELDEYGAFLESAAALLMKQLLSCINYLHFSGFVHCDLKPENILLEANKELSQIKIIDFGFAANITKAPNQRLSKRWGTLQYTAPEVFAGDYGKKVDLWSAGVICFLLLSDEFPFSGDTREELMQNVKRGAFSFSSEHWSHVSELGKDFVAKLLTLDEDKRMSASEALAHPWIRLMTDSAMTELKPADFNATAQALSNLMKFSAKSKLKQATYTLIASQLLLKEEKQAIGAVFKRLDKTCNGRLSRTEIRLALRNFLGADLSDKQVDDVFRRVDVACTGYIEYSEFLMAAMSESWILNSGLLRRAFDVFDVNKTGFITIENLKVALAGFLTGNDVVDNALIAKIMREIDTDRDSVISYGEFMAAMSS